MTERTELLDHLNGTVSCPACLTEFEPTPGQTFSHACGNGDSHWRDETSEQHILSAATMQTLGGRRDDTPQQAPALT